MCRFFCVITCIAFLAQPAAAGSAFNETGTGATESEVPVIFDAFLMRPIGVAVTVLGFGAWAVTAPIQAMTRPTDMVRTFKSLVINPARFTFVDRLGEHPNRSDAGARGEIE